MTIRDEFKAQVNAADASAASAAMGGPPVKPSGPISGPANSPSPVQQSAMHTASCFLGASAAVLLTNGSIIEAFEARAAHLWGGSLALIGWGSTGHCGF